MPPKKDYDRIFLPFTVAVEKKINKLALFMERLEDDDTISEFQLSILLTHAEALRGNLAHWKPTGIVYAMGSLNVTSLD